MGFEIQVLGLGGLCWFTVFRVWEVQGFEVLGLGCVGQGEGRGRGREGRPTLPNSTLTNAFCLRVATFNGGNSVQREI